MFRSVALATAACALAQAQSLERFLSGPERSDLRWSVVISPPTLSPFQRMMVRMAIRVDGKEIAARSGRGKFVFAAEIRDRANRPYRTHHVVDLEEFKNATARHELESFLYAFLLPGDFKATLAVLEPGNGKASVVHRAIHVAEPGNDPLNSAWRELPPVEIIEYPDAPDRWFLPGESGGWQLKLHRPLDLRILANVAPSLERRRQRRAFDTTMAVMIPALKVLSRIDLAGGSRRIAVADVLRRRVGYDRDDLDWPALKQALDESNPNMIDAAALKDRDQDAQFFATEAGRRAEASAGSRCALIVLSAPLAFQSHQEIHPLEVASAARVFYLRFQTVPLWAFGRGPGVIPAVANDDLAPVIKTLQPKVFDIFSPADFRKALGAILREFEQ